MNTNTNTARHARAAVLVLTSRELFSAVVACMPGYTQSVIALASRVVQQHRRYIAYQSTSFRSGDAAAGDEDPRLLLTERGMLPYAAIKDGDVPMLETLFALQRFAFYRANDKLAFVHAPARAVQFGHLHVLEWLHARHIRKPSLLEWDSDLLRLAIRYRHVDIMDWIMAHYPEDAARTGVQHIHWRARAGNLAILEWLHSRGFAFTTREMDLAATHDHLADVTFLHTHRTEGCSTDAMDAAATRGHMDVLAFLHAHRTEGCTTRAMDGAAASGYLDSVTFLHAHRDEGCTTDAMDDAAMNGHLTIVEFLHTHRSEGCTVRAMDAAAANGHVDVIAFLGRHRREGCSHETLVAAARRGNADVVRALCTFATGGCLVGAYATASAYHRNKVVKELQHFMDPSVTSCSIELHSAGGARPCQRLGTSQACSAMPPHDAHGTCTELKQRVWSLFGKPA